MNPEEILRLAYSNQNSLGMTPEEIARRQRLIENLLSTNPTLAADVAKGPYRVNGGPGPSAQEAWSRGPAPQSAAVDPNAGGPIMGAINQWRNSTPSVQAPQAPASTSGPVNSGTAPWGTQGPPPTGPAGSLGQSGVRGAPPQTPAVNVNVSGVQPSGYQYQTSTFPQVSSFPMQPDPNFTYPQFDMGVMQPGQQGNFSPQTQPSFSQPPGGQSSMNMPLSGQTGYMTPQGYLELQGLAGSKGKYSYRPPGDPDPFSAGYAPQSAPPGGWVGGMSTGPTPQGMPYGADLSRYMTPGQLEWWRMQGRPMQGPSDRPKAQFAGQYFWR